MLLGLCTAGWTQHPKGHSHASHGKSYAARSHQARRSTGGAKRPSSVKNATQTPTVSVIGYYHRLGNGEEFSMPEWAQEKEVTRQIKSSVYKRSRESLLLEAQKLGLAPQYWDTYTNEELEKFILSYNGLYNMGRNVRARWEKPQEITSWLEEDKLRSAWAETQKDYFEENYLRNYMDTNEAYNEPWNPAVKSLRILVVNDGYKYLRVLQQGAAENPQVSVAGVASVKMAIEALEVNPHAFDVILTDMAIEDETGDQLSMYVWNQRLNIPVIWYSAEFPSSTYLLSYNIVGRIEVACMPDFADEVFNYLSNIVATGRAFPNAPLVSP